MFNVPAFIEAEKQKTKEDRSNSRWLWLFGQVVGWLVLPVFLDELGGKDLFAIRQGVLKFRGYVVRDKHQLSTPPQDSDFVPKFEQKGVDMRIGLDMALFSANRSAELISLMTNDTDCIPAMKYARRAGIQVGRTGPIGKKTTLSRVGR